MLTKANMMLLISRWQSCSPPLQTLSGSQRVLNYQPRPLSSCTQVPTDKLVVLLKVVFSAGLTRIYGEKCFWGPFPGIHYFIYLLAKLTLFASFARLPARTVFLNPSPLVTWFEDWVGRVHRIMAAKCS